MVQIIQSEPTQRQSALEMALGQALQGFGSSYLQGQQTQRQQALADTQTKLKLYEMGIANPDQALAQLKGEYKQTEIAPAQPAQYGQELAGPVMPGQSPLKELLSAAVPAQMSPVNPLGTYSEAKKAQMEALRQEKENKDSLAKSTIKVNEARALDLSKRPEERAAALSNREALNNSRAIEKDRKVSMEGKKEIDALRREITMLPATKAMTDISTAYEKIISAPKTAAGDMSRIFGFMKIQDPGSTVREGEYANAQNAASLPERVRSAYNRTIDGEKLTDIQRADFENTAKQLAEAQFSTYNEYIKPQKEAIKQRGLDESLILPSFSFNKRSGVGTPAASSGSPWTKYGGNK